MDRLAALIITPQTQLLDHIAPLAETLKIPLIALDDSVRSMAKTYYPMVELFDHPYKGAEIGKLSTHFDHFVTCDCHPHLLKMHFQNFYGKQTAKILLAPHGMSDKPNLHQYPLQDGVLLYGKTQLKMLEKANLLPLKSYTLIGNYRLEFYKRHQTFYDEMANKAIFSHLRKGGKIALYAPTWNDEHRPLSFQKLMTKLINELNDDITLIIKPHPLLKDRSPEIYYPLEGKIKERKNFFLLHEFPPIFPLLEKVDLLIGDYSSIGYDFLYREKPMLLFQEKEPYPLLSAAEPINEHENINLQIERAEGKPEAQKNLFEAAFCKEATSSKIRLAIGELLAYDHKNGFK